MSRSRVTLVALACAIAACATLFTTKIADIKNEPRRYDQKTVTIAGTVSSSLNVLGFKVFEVDDGTGTIRVVTKRAVPREGAKVRVTGRVDQAFAIGGTSFVVLVEQEDGP